LYIEEVENYGNYITSCTCTAKIKGKTASFTYKDDRGNRGKGTIKISGSKLKIKATITNFKEYKMIKQ
jgi:hypothetical protein